MKDDKIQEICGENVFAETTLTFRSYDSYSSNSCFALSYIKK